MLPRRTAIPLLLALALAAAGGAGADNAVQEPPRETALEARAKALLRSFARATTKEAMASVREQLLATADTLEAAGDDVLASHCLERAGMACYRFAEYDRAAEIWARGLAVSRRSGDSTRVAALLNARAVGVSIVGDDERAVELQTELIGLRRALGDVRGEGVSWHNLAYSYFALFKYPEAIDAISNALRLHREAGNTFGLAGSMGTLANALFEVGRVDDAMAMADSAVARSRSLGDPAILGQALMSRARQRHYAGRLEESLADYAEAHDVLTAAGAVRQAAVSDVNRADALISAQRCDDARAVIDAARGTLEPIGTAAERVWGGCVAARVLARCGDEAAARPALAVTIERLEAARDSMPDEISRADAFRMAGGAYTELAVLDARAGRAADAWRTVESGSARLLRSELGSGDASGATLAQLREQLRSHDAVALQYGFATADLSVACVVTPDTVRAVPLPIPPGFRAALAGALQLMSSGAGDAECAPALERVARVVLAPIADALTGHRLVVFPGMLSGFPVEALPLDGGDVLGDRFPVTYAPSASTFLSLQERTLGPGPVVAFADPSPAPPGVVATISPLRSALGALPEARAEGEAVTRAGGGMLAGEDATRPAFLAQAPDAAVIHVAAHAVVDGNEPDLSAIVLAGGVPVTAGELRRLSIRADLVSLSACETAGGYHAAGEGAFGLTRAFLRAGARTVVSSWWAVDDHAARRFMELFYEALRGGAARDEALRRARLDMAAEGFTHRDRNAFALTGATAEPVAAVAATSRWGGSMRTAAAVILVIALLVVIRRFRSRSA